MKTKNEVYNPLIINDIRTKMGGRKTLSINGLKSYAAIGVVAMHVLSNISAKPTECFITENVISPMGELVFLFMMISAFGMCCGYYEKVKSGQMKPSDFYRKRYARILPFFALVVCLDLVYAPSWASLIEGFSDVTLVFGLYSGCDIKVIGVGWFLGTIFVFYMLFPFFIFLLDNKRRAWIVLLFSLIWQLLMMHYYHAGNSKQILHSAPYFIMGGLIFLYLGNIGFNFQRKSMLKWMGLISCLLLTIVFNFIPEVHQTIFGRNLPRLILYSAWLCYALGTNQWLLNNRLTAYLGDISMEIYLCHMVLFRVVEKIHIERFVTDYNLNYVITFFMTLIGAIMFLCVVIKVLKSVNHSLLSKFQHTFIACCSINSIVDFPLRMLA